jgi:hypothetical protein
LQNSTLLVLVLMTVLAALVGCESTTANDATTSTRSIRGWVSCTGTSDDTAGVAKAFAAARHGAFTLVVDCPVKVKVGMDIARTIFIDDDTTVEFTGAGKFTVDNVFIPAFVIADSSHITMTNWNVEYDSGLPVDQNVGGHTNDGLFVRGPRPANAFTDSRLTQWLSSNRAIVFDRRQGNVNAFWVGATNPCAVFFITGDSSNIRVTGMQLYVPETAGGDRFVPVAFALGGNFRAKQTVTANTPMTAQYFAVPHDVTFSNIRLDGTYMGWVGGVRDAVFENIRSQRYGDLQDAHGQNVGGLNKWFAPPHLFYFGYSTTGDAELFNRNIQIRNVIDSGIRVGKARDDAGTVKLSGYALSLKLGCVSCSVNGYSSARPDGFMDVLTSDGMTVSNVNATYDSAFINNLYPGWRFPSTSYKNVQFENITLTDSAATTVQPPIGNAGQASNEDIVFKNVHVELNRWAGPADLPLPVISGKGNELSMDYFIKSHAQHIARSQTGSLQITLEATPAELHVGASTMLTWAAKGANHCDATGAWSGDLATSGSRTVNTTADNPAFTLSCENGPDRSSATLPLAVSP